MKLISLTRTLLVALAVVLLGFAMGTPARADGSDGVTLLHGIPGTPVDVVVDGQVLFKDFAPGQTQDLSASAGTTLKQVEVRPAGSTTAVIGPADIAVPATGNWTLVAHLDAAGKPKLSALQNDVSATKAGQGRLVVVHAAAAPAVDLVVGTTRPITNLSNGASQALDLDASTVSGAKLALTGQDPAIDVPTVEVKAGVSLIVYAVGSLADNTLTFYTQTINVGENAPSATPSPSASVTPSPSASATASATPSSSASVSKPPVPTASSTLNPVSGYVWTSLFHAIPGVAVDVLIDGEVVSTNLQAQQLRDTSKYQGPHEYEIRLAGTQTTVVGPKVINMPVQPQTKAQASAPGRPGFEVGSRWLLVIHLDATGKPTLTAVDVAYLGNGLTADNSIFTVVHAAAAPAVDVVVGTERPFTNLTNGTWQTGLVPGGSISDAKLAPTGAAPIADIPPIEVPAQRNVLVFVVGSLSEGTLTYYTVNIGSSLYQESTSPTALPSATATTSPTATSNELPIVGDGPAGGTNRALWGWVLLLTVAVVTTLATTSRRGGGAHR